MKSNQMESVSPLKGNKNNGVSLTSGSRSNGRVVGNSATLATPFHPTANWPCGIKQPITGLCLLIGTTVIDAFHTVQNLVIEGNSVAVDGPDGREVIPCNGPRLQLGGKTNATVDLNAIAARLKTTDRNGGGAINSLRELNRLREAFALPFKLRLVDTGKSSKKLNEELARLHAEYRWLNLAPVGLNLVLVLDAAGRLSWVVLRGPASEPVSLNGEWGRAEAGVDSDLRLVIINSPRSDAAAKAGVLTARRSGAFLTAILTPSTSLDCRLRTLLANSHLSVANLTEFRELVVSLGIECPSDEHFTSVPRIAHALSELIEIVEPAGDVIVTLGESGQVIYDMENGVIFHMGLTSEAKTTCRNYLPATRINGIGDAYAANAAAAWTLFPIFGNGISRTIHAARRAWTELLEGSNPRFIHPNVQWFVTRVISTGLRSRQAARSDNGIRQNVSWAEQAL